MIGISFCGNIDDNGKNIIISLGGGFVASGVLALLLDAINRINKKKHSENIFRFVNIEVYRAIIEMFMIFDSVFKDIDELHFENEDYKAIDIAKLFEIYSNRIKEVEQYLGDERAETNTLKKKISVWNESFKELNDRFRGAWKRLNEISFVLIINEIATKKDIEMLESFLRMICFSKIIDESEFGLIRLGRNLANTIKCNLCGILDKIGFKEVKFNYTDGHFDFYEDLSRRG